MEDRTLQDSPETRAELLTSAGIAKLGMRWDTPKDSALVLKGSNHTWNEKTQTGKKDIITPRAPFLVIVDIAKCVKAMGAAWLLLLLNAALRNKIQTGALRPPDNFRGEPRETLMAEIIAVTLMGIKVRAVAGPEVQVRELLTIGKTLFVIRSDESPEVQAATELAYQQQYLAEMADMKLPQAAQDSIRKAQGF
jgi:hypothetical protein